MRRWLFALGVIAVSGLLVVLVGQVELARLECLLTLGHQSGKVQTFTGGLVG